MADVSELKQKPCEKVLKDAQSFLEPYYSNENLVANLQAYIPSKIPLCDIIDTLISNQDIIDATAHIIHEMTEATESKKLHGGIIRGPFKGEVPFIDHEYFEKIYPIVHKKASEVEASFLRKYGRRLEHE